MVAILTPRRLRELLDVTQPQGTGLPDQGVPVLYSSNSSFVIQTIAAGGGGSFLLGASNLGNTLGDTGVTGTRVVLAAIGNATLSQATDANGGTVSISVGTAGAGFSGGVSGGNTAGDTGATGTRLVFAGGNNITLSQATNANGGTITISGANLSQSVQTQNLFDLTIDGNTAGAGALVSSGTLTLAGGSNITLSQNGNAISIIGNAAGTETQVAISGIANSQTTYTSGTVSLSALGALTIRSTTGNAFQFSVNSQSVQPETQTFVGGVAGSNTTYTSGTVEFTGSNMVTVKSSAGQRLVIDATQSVQTQNAVDVTLAGNTAGALALVSSGTLTLAGGNNITLSQAGNAVTISGPAAAGAQTAISGIVASNATYTSGTVTFTGVGGGVTVSSNTGQRIDISVAAPVAQTGTQFSAGISGGNTSGNSGTVAGRVVFAGGNNITLSGSTNGVSETITISAFNQSAQTFLGALAASNTTYTSGTVTITGVGGGITVSSNTGQRIDLSVAAQTVESQSFGMSNIGNTSGTTGIASGGQVRFLLAGGNNITLSQSLNGASGTITISAPNAQTAISGLANSQTTYTSGTVSLSELGAITIRSTTGNQFQFSVNSQTVQTQNVVDVTISGNTSGAGALISSGTMTLAGGNNITVSQAGNAITISGANVGGAQTGISGLANSQTTYTSGTVSLSELGAITIRSTTGNQFQFSVNSQTVQTQSLFSAGVSTGGNTSGDTGVTGTRMVFVGSNNITLSQGTAAAGATITISGPTTAAQTADSGGGYAVGNTYSSSSGTFDVRTLSIRGDGIISVAATNSGWRISASQSVQAETQTFVGGLAASNTTYTSGTVTITGVGGGITVSSNTGQRIDLSVAAQTVQTQNLIDVTLSGNTSGALALISSGTMTLAGGNNITLSQAGNAVTISAGAGGGFSAGMSNIGNTSGDTGITGSRLVLAGGNNITLSQSTNASGGTVTISAPNAQTGISGIANSQTTYTSGTVSLSELGAITIRSTTGNQYQFSVNSQTVQTQSLMSVGVSTGGNTAGDTGVTGTRMVFVGSQNITLSQATAAAGGTITIQGPVTAAQTADSGGAYAVGNTYSSSSGTFDVRTLSIRGDGIISVAATNSGWRISASQSVQAETQTFVGGIAASNTTYTSGTITITGVGGGVTVSSNTGQRVDISVAAQTVESQSIGASNLGNTLGTSGVASGGQVRAVIIGTSNITVSQSVNGASATLSLIGQPAFSAGMSNIGNTSGDTGITATRLVLAGGNNITLSQSTNASGGTVTISAPNLGAGAMSVGVSTGGNTAGSTGVTGTRLVLVGTNNLSLSQSTDANGGTVSFNNTVSAFQAGVSTGGNTTGDTGVTGTRLVFVGSSPISLSQATGANGGTISINAPATSSLSGVSNVVISTNGSTISIGYRDQMADWQNMPRQGASLISHVSAFSKTPIYWNDHIDGQLTAKSLAFAISMVTASQPLSVSAHLGIYTFVNSTSAALLGSVSEAYVVSSASSVSLSGVRNLVMTGIGTHTALSVITAGEYVIGMMFSATATNAMNFSLVGASAGAGPLGGIYPGTNQLTTGTSQGISPLEGRGSTTVNAMPANVSQADLVNQGTAASQPLHAWIYIRS